MAYGTKDLFKSVIAPINFCERLIFIFFFIGKKGSRKGLKLLTLQFIIAKMHFSFGQNHSCFPFFHKNSVNSLDLDAKLAEIRALLHRKSKFT